MNYNNSYDFNRYYIRDLLKVDQKSSSFNSIKSQIDRQYDFYQEMAGFVSFDTFDPESKVKLEGTFKIDRHNFVHALAGLATFDK